VALDLGHGVGYVAASTEEDSVPEVDPAYTELPKSGPYDVAIGGALITMVEPHVGTEEAYNRWYEDDHYYSGAMAMPWMFAGRRFVATRDLQLLRYPADSLIAQPVTLGPYLHLYWISEGRMDDHIRWTSSTNYRLREDNRIHLQRDHIYTSFQDYVGDRSLQEDGPKDIHSLDYPYEGLVMEVIDATAGHWRDEVLAWLFEDYLPWVQRQPHSPVAQSLVFTPRPLPDDKQPEVADIEGLDDRVTVLHFLTEDPRIHWMTRFAGNGERVAESGQAKMQFAGPFIPVLHGTNLYVDELR
jgi:hypothetical protein